jgi:hypothetical protein
MNAICKRSYPYDDSDNEYVKRLRIFITGSLYPYITMYSQNEIMYRVGEYGEIFTKDEFNDYFISEKEIRKEKLKRLNENTINRRN